MLIVALGLFFIVRFSRARYLLIDIEDGAIGASAGIPPLGQKRGCIQDGIHQKFALKHAPNKMSPLSTATVENAAQFSCDRNKNFPTSTTKVNTVLFGEKGWENISPTMCWASFSDVFQCKGVPEGPRDKCPIEDGLLDTLVMSCGNCKWYHPDATRFRVQVDNTSGHLEQGLQKQVNGKWIPIPGGVNSCMVKY